MMNDPKSHDESGIGMLAQSLVKAVEAMLKALLMLILAALILAARGLQAAFVLARPGLQLGSAALAGYGGFALFRSVLAHYGGDPPALLLAMLSVVIVPAFLISSRAEGFGIWAILLLSGALMMLAHYVIERAPPARSGICASILSVGLRSLSIDPPIPGTS